MMAPYAKAYAEQATKMIDILLATYQSRQYLGEQLDSLFAQDNQDFQILIRDGGSTDQTQEIIRTYQRNYPGKIHFLGSQPADACTNFSALLNASKAELIMFCDHDDVWFPQKISRTLAKYRETEAICGAATPILIFTDSRIADCDMNVIASSMFQYQHLDTKRLSLPRLIPQNVPSGNTMLINRALADLALPIPPDAVMHDHWISLTAAVFGKIVFLNEATLNYRQHSANVYGASSYSLPGMLKKIAYGRKKIRDRFEQNIRQAAAFGTRFGEKLSSHDREMLTALGHWQEYGFFQKRKLLLKYHILKSGLFRNIGTFLLI